MAEEPRSEQPAFEWSGRSGLRMPGTKWEWDGQTLPPQPSWEANGWWAAFCGLEGDDFQLGGLTLWGRRWRPTDDKVQLPHPQYPGQIHPYPIYEVESEGRTIRFAAAEVSYGVLAIWVPSVGANNEI